MTFIKVEPNHGSQWDHEINTNGFIKDNPIYLAVGGFNNLSESLSITEAQDLADQLNEAVQAISSAAATRLDEIAEAKKPKLPTESGLYVHPKFASKDPFGAMIFKFNAGNLEGDVDPSWYELRGYGRTSEHKDPEDVLRIFTAWGGYAKLVGAPVE